MEQKYLKSFYIIILVFCVSSWQHIFSQGFGSPLTVQGIDHFSIQSAASKSLGGTSLTMQNNVNVMFSNPAMLQTLRGLQISVGGVQRSINTNQTQHYSPLKYYSNFSLLMEGLTDGISKPDTNAFYVNPNGDTIKYVKPVNPGDSVQRPFDKLGPNWSRAKSKNDPIQVIVAVPFSIGDIKVSVGVGALEYSNLDWYFQNNNVLSPSILTADAHTVSRPVNNNDTSSIPVQWYQISQQRDGTIQGYGGALAFALSERMNFGVSAMILKGNSTDKETRFERGRLRFYADYFRAESVYYYSARNGTSDYTGEEITVSGAYLGKFVGFGFSLKLPTTITRKYNASVQTDTGYHSKTTKLDSFVTTVKTIKGEDKITIPLRGTVAISLALRENLTLGVEYELRPYASAEYTISNGTTTNPWLSSNIFHIGMEFRPTTWLSLRAGAQEQAEIFQPVGNPLDGDPVSYTVYSCGGGLKFENVRFNFAYEYSKINYTDMWAGAVSISTKKSNAFFADLSYEIPW